jgi:two-component system alkaline phosphatase synthesis response regulator PhoP
VKLYSQSRRKRTVLVVEDDDTLGRLISESLKDAGFRATWVTDGVEAINFIFERKPAAIVMDLMVPRLSGYDLCRLVRRCEAVCQTPIVVVSGHGEMDNKLQVFALGADDFVTKPFSAAELVARVKALLDLARRVVNPLSTTAT